MSLLEDVRAEATRSGASASAIATQLGVDEFLVAHALRLMGAQAAPRLNFTGAACASGGCASAAETRPDATPRGCKGCPFAPNVG